MLKYNGKILWQSRSLLDAIHETEFINSANHSAPISNVDPAHLDHALARQGGSGCGRPVVSPACGVYGIQIAIYAIEDQRMQVDVQVRGRRRRWAHESRQ